MEESPNTEETPEMEESANMEETPAMGFPQRVIGIIFYPGKVFESIRAKPSVLAPLLLVAIMAAGAAALLAPFGAQLAEEQILKLNPEAPPEVIEQAKQQATSTTNVVIGMTTPFITISIFVMLIALLCRMIYTIGLGGDASFKSVLSVVAYANLITILDMLVRVPLTLYQNQIMFSMHLGSLVPFFEETNIVYLFLKSIDIFTGWWVCVLAIGFGILYRIPTARAAIVPFGLWGLWIVIKIGVSFTPIAKFIPGM